MPRLTISLPNNVYNRLSSIAMQYDDSMSNIINRMIQLGMISLDDEHHMVNGKNKENESLNATKNDAFRQIKYKGGGVESSHQYFRLTLNPKYMYIRDQHIGNNKLYPASAI